MSKKAARPVTAPKEASVLIPEEEASGIWQTDGSVTVSLRRVTGSALSTLVVRAPARWDIAAELYRTLFDARVQIVHGGMRRMAGKSRLEHRLELVEFDGASMDRVRREEVELQVYDLLEAVSARYQDAGAQSA